MPFWIVMINIIERRYKINNKMKFNFKKIASVITSAVMLTSTIGFAAAANYPLPFVSNGVANAAVVYGASAPTGTLVTDVAAAIDVSQKLNSLVTTTGSSTITGEAVSLNSGSTKVWLNTSLNTAKTTLTKSDLPTVLGESTFSGNVDSKITSTITVGGNNITFAKQPSSNDDPVIGISTTTDKARPLYTASITMPVINFTSSDSKGQTLHLFGKDYIVSTASDATDLVLFSSAKESTLTLGGSSPTPSTTVNIGGQDYVVSLVTGSSTTATISVNQESKEITEGQSKKIGGIDVALKSVTESTAINTITADLLIGSDKITFTNASQVTLGADQNPIDGTYVLITGTKTVEVGSMTGMSVAVYAPDSSNDAILEGQSFVDPVFGTFKVAFTGLNVPMVNSSDRETIKVDRSGDKGLSLTMTDSDSNTKTFDFVYNSSTTFLGDSNGYRISNLEGLPLNQNNYTIVGNEDYGHLIQVTQIYNNTGSDYSKDAVKFQDVISGDTYSMDPTSEGGGTLTVDGRQYTVAYVGSGDTGNVTLKDPTSESSATQYVLYPTIETSKGALVSLYEPVIVNLSQNYAMAKVARTGDRKSVV